MLYVKRMIWTSWDDFNPLRAVSIRFVETDAEYVGLRLCIQ
jgi:hypothetical protein